MTETLANGYSSESTQQELSNDYQHDRVKMVFKNIFILALWMKGASALERLSNLCIRAIIFKPCTGELGYDGPLYDGFLHMTDDMLGPSPMHIKYSSYVYNGFCI